MGTKTTRRSHAGCVPAVASSGATDSIIGGWLNGSMQCRQRSRIARFCIYNCVVLSKETTLAEYVLKYLGEKV